MIQVSRNDGGSVAAPIKGAIPVPATGSWFHFAWVFNGTSDTLYINGVAGSTTPSHSSTTTGNGNNYIGTRVPSGNPFDGRLDEMRVAATARSANWISAQYASMNGTFSTLGNEQVVVTGFEPEYDYEYPPSGRKKTHRRAPAPVKVVAPSARPPRERGSTSRRTSTIAADGFDFSKPYECATPRPATAQADGKPAPTPEQPHQRRRPVAALLGGLGRKQGVS